MDTSIHAWLEDRSSEPIGIAAITDDTTGLVLARFYRGETVEGTRSVTSVAEAARSCGSGGEDLRK
jgi:hypothetical protein